MLASAAVSCLVIAAGHVAVADSTVRKAVPNSAVVDQAPLPPKRVETPLTADHNPGVFARAGKTRDALGFPAGVNRTGRHVKDGFQKTEYDEVDEVDASGQPVSITEFDASGRLTVAVRLDKPGLKAARVSGDAAGKSAQRALAAAGLTAAGTPKVEASGSSDGWDVSWARASGTVPVRGDETRVRLWSDGRVESVAHVEHSLAPEPARRIDVAAARQVASRTATGWFASRGSGYKLESIDLQWVGPNGAFDPNSTVDTQASYRLAWVANVKPSGAAAEYLRLVTVFIDVEDGSIIGGDVIE